MTRFLTALFCVFALSGCGDGSTPLTITNKSGIKLETIQASGSGFAAYIGDLEPGGLRKVRIYPHGKASLGLTFKANGRQFSSPASGYFESGYNVSVFIAPDMNVVVDGKL